MRRLLYRCGYIWLPDTGYRSRDVGWGFAGGVWFGVALSLPDDKSMVFMYAALFAGIAHFAMAFTLPRLRKRVR